MKIIENKIFKLLEPHISNIGYELAGCEYIAQGRNTILKIFIDKDQGINLDDCKEVLKFVNPLLDVEDIIQGKYNLEISSPGANRPLSSIQHFKKYINNTVLVKMGTPINGRRNFKGELLSVTESSVKMLVDDKNVVLEFDLIDKANLVREFK